MVKPVGIASGFALTGLIRGFEMEVKKINEKKIFFVFACVIGLCGVFTGCETTRIDDSGIVERNSRAVGQLEATVSSLDRTVAASRERIGAVVSSSRDIEDGIARLEFLFKCYEREVVGLLAEIGRIRSQIETKGENDSVDGGIFGSVVIGAGSINNAEHEMGD